MGILALKDVFHIPHFCKRGRFVTRNKIHTCFTVELVLHRGGNLLQGTIGEDE